MLCVLSPPLKYFHSTFYVIVLFDLIEIYSSLCRRVIVLPLVKKKIMHGKHVRVCVCVCVGGGVFVKFRSISNLVPVRLLIVDCVLVDLKNDFFTLTKFILQRKFLKCI